MELSESAAEGRRRVTPKAWWYFIAFVLILGMYRCYPRTPEFRVRSNWDGERITGTAQNTTRARTFSNINLEFVLLDENGDVLSTVTAKKAGLLAAGEHWAFDIEASAVGAESHRREYAGWHILMKPAPLTIPIE